MSKINPFQMNPGVVEPQLIEELKAKATSFSAKAQPGGNWDDDLWAAYQQLLSEKPDKANAITDAWELVSSEMTGNKPFDILGLAEYDDVYWRESDNAWYGFAAAIDKAERLTESVQDYEDIWWDTDYNTYVGNRKSSPKPNPGTKSIIFDAGQNAWFNIFTGEVVR